MIILINYLIVICLWYLIIIIVFVHLLIVVIRCFYLVRFTAIINHFNTNLFFDIGRGGFIVNLFFISDNWRHNLLLSRILNFAFTFILIARLNAHLLF